MGCFKKFFANLVFAVTLAWALFHHANSFKIPQPEFAEPVKNISVPAGRSIEFSCNVRNLRDHRIMWMKKEAEREVLLGINSLTLYTNTRMSISVVPNSGEITQSNLYIKSVEREDDGHYQCVVSTSPIISQIGTLEVRDVPEKPELEKIEEIREPASTTTSAPTTTTEALAEWITPTTTGETEKHSTTPPESCPISACDDPDRHVICIDFDKLWSKTRENAQLLFSWFYGRGPNPF